MDSVEARVMAAVQKPHIRSKCLGETISINPKEALIVRRCDCGSASGRPVLFAQSIDVLAFIQTERCDVNKRLDVWSFIGRAGNHNSGI
jgi:hypothetical protein